MDTASELIDPTRIGPEFEDSIIPRPYNIELLRRVAIAARGVDRAEATDLSERYLYMDLPANPNEQLAASIVATRFDIGTVVEVVARYDAVFGTPEASRLAEVASELQSAMGQYLSLNDASTLDPSGFNEFLRTSPDHERAYRDAVALNELLDRLRTMGLTRGEYVETRDRLMDPLVPADASVSARQLGEALELTAGPTPEEAGPAGS